MTIPPIRALLIAAICVVMIEAAVAMLLPRQSLDPGIYRFYPPDRVPTVGESIIFWKYYNLFNSPRGMRRDVLVIGDSSGLFGVVPEIVKNETGLSMLNLGTDGSYSIDAQTDLLEFFVGRFGAPKLVLFYMSGLGLIHGGSVQKLERIRQWVRNIQADQDAATPGSTGLTLPSLKARFYLSRKIAAGKSGVAVSGNSRLTVKRGIYPSDAEVRRALIESGGFMAEPHPVIPPQREPVTIVLADREVSMIRRLFRFAEAHGIEILMALNPVPESQDYPETVTSFTALERHLREIAHDFPRVTIEPDLLRFYPNEMTYGYAHLRGTGPVRNSHEISAMIRRWISRHAR